MNPDEDVELGAQVEARARGTVGAVVAVRVPRDLLAGISEYAKLRGLTVAEVMREGAERLVGGTVQPTHYVSGPRVDGSESHSRIAVPRRQKPDDGRR